MRLRLLVLATLSVLSGCAGSSPEALSSSLQAALDKGDMDAALALGDFSGTPPRVLFFYMNMVVGCAHQNQCTVSTGPYDEQTAKRQETNAQSQGFQFGGQPDGVLLVASTPRDGSKGSGKVTLPIGKVGGEYRVLSGSYTPEKLAEQRARSTESLLEETMAEGIYDAATGTRQTNWKEVATALPADGGEAGQWYLNNLRSLHKANKDGDLAAAIKLYGGEHLYGENDLAGKPVPKAARLLTLRAWAAREMADAKILGGYQYGNHTLLMVEGTTSSGWIERGAMLVSKTDRGFQLRPLRSVSHPAP